MAYDDDNDENESDGDQDEDMEIEDEGNDEQEGEGGEEDDDEGDDDNGDDDDDEDDNNEQDSPSRRTGMYNHVRRSASRDREAQPPAALTSPSIRSPGAGPKASYIPPVRDIALLAQAYDIVPTMAAPQGTSINAVAATPDMKWVFSGGTDGYVRMYNWVETANGRVPLTVAQKHAFVDSVMKAGSLVTYWENEDSNLRTPPAQTDEGKWTSPVYSLAVQHQALWLLSGLESGGINLQTCRHQAGTRITTLKEHTNAVSVLALSQDETNLLSGSWDKLIHDWDLQTGKVKRSYKGSGGQISAIEIRPTSDLPVPEVTEIQSEAINGTFSSNNADKLSSDGLFGQGFDDMSRNGEDAAGSPGGGSLFGEGDGDNMSLFGEDAGGGGGGGFNDDDDELARALESEMQDVSTQDAPITAEEQKVTADTDEPMQQSTEEKLPDAQPVLEETVVDSIKNEETEMAPESQKDEKNEADRPSQIVTNGLPHSGEPLTAPPTNEPELPPQSGSTFLDASQDGTLRIWDRRAPLPVATILPYAGTPPWCTGACWSPDGNFFYAGRRNGTVEEFSIHHLGTKRSEPNRVFKFQQGSGPVYSVRAMPNSKHLLCASNDILRIYDLKQAESRHKVVPFTIVPGHRGGVISSIYVDPTCRFMLSASGNRGWEGSGTEVLLGYEIGVQDEQGIWHK